ncbi:MAG: thioredoxin domain-containing protein [Haliea sp.]|nr:thioredoxin domain-containing protein [Haliea sp.]
MSHQIELFEPINSADHVLGNEHAFVVIVEYGDFECPSCKQAASAVQQLLNRFADQVLFAYRHFPLTEVHGHALGAAQPGVPQHKVISGKCTLYCSRTRPPLTRKSLDR